jgi:hypothetical protein
MQSLTREKCAASAYRTLGLSASADQAAIDAAARKMRIWPDPQRIPATRWDMKELGPLDRSRNMIEQAVSRLHEPQSRLEERLLWYHGEAPPVAAVATMDSAAASTDSHYAAVQTLHAALADGGDAPNLPLWQNLIDRFNDLAVSPRHIEWLARVEEEGNFEKRSSRAEMEAALRSLPAALAASLIQRAQAVLDQGDLRGCSAILLMLRATGAADAFATAVGGLLDRLEDAFYVHCNETDHQLRDKLRSRDDSRANYYVANFEPTRQASTFYESTINPALAQLIALAGEDIGRLQRVRTRAAQLQVLIAIGWEWSGFCGDAEGWLIAALELARGAPYEFTVSRELARVKLLAAEERLRFKKQREASYETSRDWGIDKWTVLSEPAAAAGTEPATGTTAVVPRAAPRVPRWSRKPRKVKAVAKPGKKRKSPSRWVLIVSIYFAIRFVSFLVPGSRDTAKDPEFSNVRGIDPSSHRSSRSAVVGQPSGAAIPDESGPPVLKSPQHPEDSVGETNREQ